MIDNEIKSPAGREADGAWGRRAAANTPYAYVSTGWWREAT